MQFHYVASDQNGKIKEGDTDGKTLEDVIAFIFQQGWKPISVKPIQEILKVSQISFFDHVTLQDKIFLFKYLALMLKVGTDLFKAIDVLLEDMDKPLMRSFLLEIRGNLERGNEFYLSFKNHPDLFSPIVVSLIKAAEGSGNLEQTLEEISFTYSQEAEVTNKIRAALIYPALLLTVASLIVLMLVTFVIPKISTIFEGSGAKIPTFSLIIITFGKFMNQNLAWVLPLLVGGIAGLIIFFTKVQAGRKLLSDIARRTPLVKDLIQKLALRRFATTFGSLLRAGIPFVQALETTSEAVGEEQFRTAILRIAQESIAKGVSVSDAFRKETVFPKVVINLISIGEKAGHVEEILKTLAQFYEDEIDNSLKTLVSVFEPIMLLVIGLVVAGIAFSVIVPIYQLVSQYS